MQPEVRHPRPRSSQGDHAADRVADQERRRRRPGRSAARAMARPPSSPASRENALSSGSSAEAGAVAGPVEAHAPGSPAAARSRNDAGAGSPPRRSTARCRSRRAAPRSAVCLRRTRVRPPVRPAMAFPSTSNATVRRGCVIGDSSSLGSAVTLNAICDNTQEAASQEPSATGPVPGATVRSRCRYRRKAAAAGSARKGVLDSGGARDEGEGPDDVVAVLWPRRGDDRSRGDRQRRGDRRDVVVLPADQHDAGVVAHHAGGELGLLAHGEGRVNRDSEATAEALDGLVRPVPRSLAGSLRGPARAGRWEFAIPL